MIVVTGASGHLGRLAVEALARRLPAREIVAAARSVERLKDLAARGVQVRHADYTRPETLAAAFAGAEKILLVSSSEVGARARHHAAAIEAARAARVKLLAYTSILRADRSHMIFGAEHRETEAAILASGLPHVFLRNGWYLENYTESLGPALQHGAVVGCAGTGRIAAAARADYAEAAAVVLTGKPERTVYELAGDQAFTMPALAAEVARQAGKPIAYRELPPEQYRSILVGVGLPVALAEALVDADLWAAKGELDDSAGELRRLIGRPTTTLAEAVGAAMAGMKK